MKKMEPSYQRSMVIVHITIFPTSHGDLDITVAEKLYEKLKNCNCTNMDEYIKTCIENARANRCNR